MATSAASKHGRHDPEIATTGRLTFEDVSHNYDGLPSVCGVSLDVEPGEVLCLLGQSGSGKTTLLRIAAGIERQSSGRVIVDGVEVAGPSTFLPPERRGIGLMFQDYALFPHLTIVRNVMFGLSDMARAKAEEIARRALFHVGLDAYGDDYPHALSGGEQQRVALARAMAPSPSVILMDEPFSGLDRLLREDVRDKTLSVLGRTHATCIVVTHDPEEAMRMGDRIALLRDGMIVQVGTCEELYRKPADLFVARFFSKLNEIAGSVQNGIVDTPIGAIQTPKIDDGSDVIVCLRPHDVVVSRAADNTSEGKAGGDRPMGKVTRRRFLGEVDLIDVAVTGLEKPVSARIHGSDLVVGDDVFVQLCAQSAFVFPGESDRL